MQHQVAQSTQPSNYLEGLEKIEEERELGDRGEIKFYYQRNTDNYQKSVSRQMATTNSPLPNGDSENVPAELVAPLRKLILYDRRTFSSLTISNLKFPLERIVHKYPASSKLAGQQLLLLVLNNHVRAIMDLKEMSSKPIKEHDTLSVTRSFNERGSVEVYEEIAQDFFDSDQQLNKLIILNSDFEHAQALIEKSIHNYTSRSNRLKKNKIIQSRVRMLELLLTLVRFSERHSSVSHEPLPPLPDFKAKGYNTSFHELENSHVRLIVEELDQKVRELSTISEQIPQLETYKRTLDLTMPEHNVNLTKIVDVLIELHHRVNKLMSRRPEKLQKEIDAVESQCTLIEVATAQFISIVESETSTVLKAIYFNQKKNKSPEHFRRIQKNVVKMSEHYIAAISSESEINERLLRIKSMIEIFWGLLEGLEDNEREWQIMRTQEDISVEQERMMEILEECLKIIRQQREEYLDLKDEFEQFVKNEHYISSENNISQAYLEEEINKLSQENAQLREENAGLRQEASELDQDRTRIKLQMSDWKKKYSQLLQKYELGNSEYEYKLLGLEKREKQNRDRIQSLQSENEQKKTMITNITNDLKRAMRDSETSRKFEQKNKELKDKIEKLVSEKEELEKKLREARHDIELNKGIYDQLDKNNALLLDKLDQANLTNVELTQSKSAALYQKSMELERLRSELEHARARIKELENLNAMAEEGKEKEYNNVITKKDEKITQLNSKIIELSQKLNRLTEDYKNMEFEIKRRDQIQRDLNLKIKEVELKGRQDYGDTMKDLQKSQADLSRALEQIETCHKITNDLENEIKRRQEVIIELQRIISELEDKIGEYSRKEQGYINQANSNMSSLENQIQSLRRDKSRKQQELLLKIKQLEIKCLDSTNQAKKTKELEEELRTKTRKLADFEQQLKRKNKKISELEQELRGANKKVHDLEKSLRETERKLSGNEEGLTHQIRDLQQTINRIDAENRDYQNTISQLQNKIKLLDEKIYRDEQEQRKYTEGEINSLQRRIRELEALDQNNKIKMQDYDRNIQSLTRENQSNKQRVDQLSKLHSENSRLQSQLSTLQSQVSKLQAENSRLQSGNPKLQSDLIRLQSDISRLQSEVSSKNNQLANKASAIQQLHQKIRSLEDIIRKLQAQVRESSNQLAQIGSNKQICENHIKEINYLTEKSRSLEDMIDIYNEQHLVLQAKNKQYRLKEASLKEKSSRADSYVQEINQLKYQLLEREKEFEKMRNTQMYQSQLYWTPIIKNKILDESAEKSLQNSRYEQEEVKRLELMLSNSEIRLQEEFKNWANRESNYLEEIDSYRTKIRTLEATLRSLQHSKAAESKKEESDKYYLRVEGQRLEDLVSRMQNGNHNLNEKLDEILASSRRTQNEHYQQFSQNKVFSQLMEDNSVLIQDIRSVIKEKNQLTEIIRDFPNPDFLSEYVLKIILYFSQILPDSPEGKAIWEQLQLIRQENTGGQYFVVLEQFTKYSLEENAIEIYRRQLKQKASELEALKTQLDAFLNQKLKSEERVYQEAVLSDSRMKLSREHYRGYSSRIRTNPLEFQTP